MVGMNRHIRFFQVITIGLLLFYGVASARSFFPELCNTLSSVGGKRVASVSATSCCSVPGESTGSKQCALCTLVSSLEEPVTYTSFALLFVGVGASNSPEPVAYVPVYAWNPASLRGPPVVV